MRQQHNIDEFNIPITCTSNTLDQVEEEAEGYLILIKKTCILLCITSYPLTNDSSPIQIIIRLIEKPTNSSVKQFKNFLIGNENKYAYLFRELNIRNNRA